MSNLKQLIEKLQVMTNKKVVLKEALIQGGEQIFNFKGKTYNELSIEVVKLAKWLNKNGFDLKLSRSNNGRYATENSKFIYLKNDSNNLSFTFEFTQKRNVLIRFSRFYTKLNFEYGKGNRYKYTVPKLTYANFYNIWNNGLIEIKKEQDAKNKKIFKLNSAPFPDFKKLPKHKYEMIFAANEGREEGLSSYRTTKTINAPCLILALLKFKGLEYIQRDIPFDDEDIYDFSEKQVVLTFCTPRGEKELCKAIDQTADDGDGWRIKRDGKEIVNSFGDEVTDEGEEDWDGDDF